MNADEITTARLRCDIREALIEAARAGIGEAILIAQSHGAKPELIAALQHRSATLGQGESLWKR